MRRPLQAAALLAVLMFVGCGSGQRGSDDARTPRASVLGVAGLPWSVDCGLQYVYDFNSPPIGMGCMGVPSFSPAYDPPGYLAPYRSTPFGIFHGNHGVDARFSSPLGFKLQERASEVTAPDASVSDQLLLPRGTVCGFPYGGCMGSALCPAGWAAKSAIDAGNYYQYAWKWCEYNDPHNLCANGSCVNASLPDGLTCGLSHNSDSESLTGVGHCLGMDTRFGCPPGFVHSTSFYDDGRPAGEGLGWCAKLPTPTCSAPYELCSNRCVNLSSSRYNCGACGSTCGPDEVCLYGECTCSGKGCLL